MKLIGWTDLDREEEEEEKHTIVSPSYEAGREMEVRDRSALGELDSFSLWVSKRVYMFSYIFIVC